MPEPEEKQLSQTTSEEEKSIEEQINQFVAQTQSEELPASPAPAPAAPAPAPAAPAPTAEPIEKIAVAVAPTDPTNVAANNAAKLATAVNGILGSEAKAPEQSTPQPSSPVPVEQSVDPGQQKTEEPDMDNEPHLNQDTPSAPKKVINPLNDLSSKGPDLDALLQKEQEINTVTRSVVPEPTEEELSLPQKSDNIQASQQQSTTPIGEGQDHLAAINISDDGTIISTDSAGTTDPQPAIIEPVPAPEPQQPETVAVPTPTPTPTQPTTTQNDPNHPNNIAL
jgi:hypothetical protein